MDEPKFSILIVDDEKTNLDVLNNMLKHDYSISVAKTGEAALNRALSNKPDLILLDILMPDMNGYDVLLALKNSDVTRSIPVIFITGLSSTNDEERGFMLGAVDYITKPFVNSIVRARVKTHLQIVKQIRTIERLGMIDALTDIPNRRLFDSQLKNEWAHALRDGTTISVMMIDADKFKNYNDTHGHPKGDALLQLLPRVFSASIRRGTDLVARIGGEEFAVLLPNTSLTAATQIAEQMRVAVENSIFPPDGEGNPTYVTISIGVAACLPTAKSEITDLMAKADIALYTAKRKGRNQVCSIMVEDETAT